MLIKIRQQHWNSSKKQKSVNWSKEKLNLCTYEIEWNFLFYPTLICVIFKFFHLKGVNLITHSFTNFIFEWGMELSGCKQMVQVFSFWLPLKTLWLTSLYFAKNSIPKISAWKQAKKKFQEWKIELPGCLILYQKLLLFLFLFSKSYAKHLRKSSINLDSRKIRGKKETNSFSHKSCLQYKVSKKKLITS